MKILRLKKINNTNKKKQQQELQNTQLRQHHNIKQQNGYLRQLIVGNLSPNITEEDLYKDFIELCS